MITVISKFPLSLLLRISSTGLCQLGDKCSGGST